MSCQLTSRVGEVSIVRMKAIPWKKKDDAVRSIQKRLVRNHWMEARKAWASSSAGQPEGGRSGVCVGCPPIRRNEKMENDWLPRAVVGMVSPV